MTFDPAWRPTPQVVLPHEPEWAEGDRRARIIEREIAKVEAERIRETVREAFAAEDAPEPTNNTDRTANELRPTTFDQVIGQAATVKLLRRVVDSAWDNRRALDHILFVGPSGTGKSTLANVIGNEMGVDVFQVEAPVSADTLLSLREVMRDGDILFIDEIHQQAIMERRGRQAALQPEGFYHVMEDRVIPTQNGMLPFPAITVIGATTDEGMLPDAFVNRFPLQPRLEGYTESELRRIAHANAHTLGILLTPPAAEVFAGASRGVPRQINNYVKNAEALTSNGVVTRANAVEVVEDLNGATLDGLTADMVAMLRFLYTRCKRVNGNGDVKYQASVNTIATAIGKSRDSKAIALRVEPYLIERGYVQVTHGGRMLTPEGIERAAALP